MSRWRGIVLLLVSLSPLLLVSPAQAAPPTLFYLQPAGAQRGTTVEAACSGSFDHWPPQVWVEGKGIEVKPGPKNVLKITVAADAPPGVCWIRLHDPDGATPLRPFVVGMLPEIMEKEPNNNVKTAQLIEKPAVTINARLMKPGEADCYAVKLSRGQTLVASLDANRGPATPLDGVLQIVSSDNFVLDQNDDYHGLDPQIAFTAPKDGTYVVRVFGFSSIPGADIRLVGDTLYVYRLTLTTAGFADHAFPMAVSRTEPGQVDIVGWNVPETARKLAVTPVVGQDFATLFHEQLANPVRVRVEPHPVIRQARPNDRKNPQTIALPASICGSIEAKGDVHVYQFEAKKGKRWLFHPEALSIDSTLSPALRILDATGKQLAQVERPDPRRESELAFTIPADGTYQIELRDLHNTAGPRHLYCLRVTAPEPDFALTVTTDRFVVPPGKTLDVPVTIDRRNGFNGEIELIAEGLPEGVTAEVQPPMAGAKAITVRLTANMNPASFPLRIRGKVKGKDDVARIAQATLGPPTNFTTPFLWVSVSNAKAPDKPKK